MILSRSMKSSNIFRFFFQTTLSSHKSIIESASLLLVALTKSYSPTDLSDSLLLNLFQAIVFCEPDLPSLNHLSEFLSLISENQSSKICSRFCTNESNNVMSIQRYKIHRFSIETCPLQVFSCLLQIAFKPYGNNRSLTEQTNEAAMVANITIRMMKFLRNCFIRREYSTSFEVPDILVIIKSRSVVIIFVVHFRC